MASLVIFETLPSWIAAVKGVRLPEDALIFPGQSTSDKYSTLQDLKAGRHTETDMFAGHMLRMAERMRIFLMKY